MGRIAVIGLGYGDEGKGRVVDYLCSLLPKTIVERFGGGHQVGHTVHSNGTNHIFSNFGSGTLQKCPTYWSDKCTVDPIGLLNELGILTSKGITPKLYLNLKCPITTPFEIFLNQRTAEQNGHGSVGVGFGTTIQREENYFHLQIIHLLYPEIFAEKFRNIQDCYYSYLSYQDKAYLKVAIDTFLDDCKRLSYLLHKKLYVEAVNSVPETYDNYIYEGNQGILLDQHYGFYPNVTRANCGSTNLSDDFMYDYYLVTRAYQTRHGNGFLSYEEYPHSIRDNAVESNQTHEYQGVFRKSILDIDMLNYALSVDPLKKALSKTLVVTCVDNLLKYEFMLNGEVQRFHNLEDFIGGIALCTKMKSILISNSYTGELTTI